LSEPSLPGILSAASESSRYVAEVRERVGVILGSTVFGLMEIEAHLGATLYRKHPQLVRRLLAELLERRSTRAPRRSSRSTERVEQTPTPIPEGFILRVEAAAATGLSLSALQYHQDARKLTSVKIGQKVYIREADLSNLERPADCLTIADLATLDGCSPQAVRRRER